MVEGSSQMYHKNKVLALAGIFQAANLVHGLAHDGTLPEASFTSCINSLFELNPDSIDNIYGATCNLELGLKTLIATQQGKSNRDLIRYALALIHLERKLIRNTTMLDTISTGIARANKQAEIFSPTHSNVIANLAGIYTDTISNFKFRIHIVGKPELLNNNEILNQIRALLLAGMRSTILWRQLGGSRIQLIFSRKKLIATATELLAS